MTKNMMLKALQDFFVEKKVETMSLVEYKGYGSDVPVKDYLLRRAFGSWSRVLNVAKHRHPIEVPVVEAPVVEEKVVKKAPASKPKAKKEVSKDVE